MCFKDTIKFKEMRLSRNTREEKQALRMGSEVKEVRGAPGGTVYVTEAADWRRLMYVETSVYHSLEGNTSARNSKERQVAFRVYRNNNLKF